jgi:tetratricopeptide (TPR) repeat protein
MYVRLFLSTLVLACASAVPAQEPAAEELPVQPFCSDKAQPFLDRGYFLLHNFEHEWARQEFMTASAIDPECALAYAGEALSFYHPLQGAPSMDDLTLGWDASQRALKAKKQTMRDKRFLGSVELLFKNYKTVRQGARDIAFHNSMQRVHRIHRDDVDMAAFYALSLLALTDGDDERSLARRAEAIRTLETYYRGYPDHPGIVNYLLHALEDSQETARRGLKAARAYPALAPDVPHAQHMPAHIYLRLGMWHELLERTTAADTAAVELMKTLDLPPDRRGLHNLSWKIYALTQLGRIAEARAVLEEVRQIADSVRLTDVDTAYVAMRYRFVVDGRQWSDAVALEVFTEEQRDEILTNHARLLGGWLGGDAEAVRVGGTALKRYGQAVVERFQAEAILAMIDGNVDDMLSSMKRLAWNADRIVPSALIPMPVLPAHELFGEMLLYVGDTEFAAKEFAAGLELYPNRPTAILGLARAASMRGDHDEARARLGELWLIWDRADADYPPFVEALNLPEARAAAATGP